MALDGNAMGDAVVTAILAQNPGTDPEVIRPYWRKICTAMVSYMTANCEVLPNTLASPIGQAVQVAFPSGTGATVTTGPLVGKGKLS